jgi:hypothetical protein
VEVKAWKLKTGWIGPNLGRELETKLSIFILGGYRKLELIKMIDEMIPGNIKASSIFCYRKVGRYIIELFSSSLGKRGCPPPQRGVVLNRNWDREISW